MAIEFKSPTVAKNTITDRLEKQGREAKLQEKSVEYTQNKEYEVLPDSGYDGMSKVNVSVDVVVPTVQNSKTVNINTNGTKTILPDADYDVVEQVIVNTDVQPKLQEKTVDVLLGNTTTNILPDSGYDGMSSVTVNHSPVESNTAYTATSNGQYTIHPSEGFDATTSVNLTVNVPTSGTLDISNKFINCVGRTISQSDIDSFTGWNNLTDGSYKFYNTKNSDQTKALVLPSFSGLTIGDHMFRNNFSGVYGPYIDVSKVDFSSVTSAKLMFNHSWIIPGDNFKLYANDSPNIFNDARIEGAFSYSAFYKDDFTYLGNCQGLFAGADIQYGDTLDLRLNSNNYSNMFTRVSTLTDLSLHLDNPGGINGIDISRLITSSSITKLTLSLPNGSSPNNYGEYSYNSFASENLVDLTINVINNSVYLKACTNLSQESVNNVLNALADGVTDKEITFAATQYAYITEEQKQAATAKGWTIKSA